MGQCWQPSNPCRGHHWFVTGSVVRHSPLQSTPPVFRNSPISAFTAECLLRGMLQNPHACHSACQPCPTLRCSLSDFTLPKILILLGSPTHCGGGVGQLAVDLHNLTADGGVHIRGSLQAAWA